MVTVEELPAPFAVSEFHLDPKFSAELVTPDVSHLSGALNSSVDWVWSAWKWTNVNLSVESAARLWITLHHN